MAMRVDLLAIAAHPDDVELTCGGTLLKMAQRGYRTGILDLTAGEMGTRGTPETRAKDAGRGGFGCAGDATEQVAAGNGDSRVATADGDFAILGGAASGSLSRVGVG